jgi:hypothetical protein
VTYEQQHCESCTCFEPPRVGDTVEWRVRREWGGRIDYEIHEGVVMPTSKKVPEGEVNVMSGHGSVITMSTPRLRIVRRLNRA